MFRKSGIVALALALVLAVTPATPRAQTTTEKATPRQKIEKYVGCAVAIALTSLVWEAACFTVLICYEAYKISDQ